MVWKQVEFSGYNGASVADLFPQLKTEFNHGAEESQVRYRGGVRQTCVFKKLDALNGQQQISPNKIRGVYLISGGAGGLGERVARHIAKRYGPKLALVGRRPLDERISSLLEELENLGSKCLYSAADVSDGDEVRRLVEQTRDTLGPINGIVHAAGLCRDSLVTNKTLSSFREVLRPKVYGAYHLDSATRDEPLDLVVYFSSISALLGNMGQTDYSFANAFLDHFAQQRERLRERGLRQGAALSINWPMWQNGGMQIDEQVQQFSERALGLPALSDEQGLELFDRCLGMGVPQVFAAHGEQTKLDKWFGLGSADRSMPPSGRAQVETASTSESSADNQQILEALQRDLVAGVVEILEVDPKDAEVDTDLNRFGFDSLTFTTFGNRIAEELLIELTPVVFFEYETIRELSEYMFSEYRNEIVGWYTKRYPEENDNPAKPEPAVPQRAVVATAEEPVAPANGKIGVGSLPVTTEERVKPGNATADPKEPIAIIGLDGCLPQSSDLDQFWEHLCNSENLITEVPHERWDWKSVWGDPFQERNKTRIKWGGFIPDVDRFDAPFFGISRREAELMDPQHRIFLQIVWRCIENAGYRASSLASQEKVGLFCGSASIDYHDIMLEGDVDIDVFAVTGSMFSVLVNRISYLLDFRGPSEPVETACSSSLVAVHRAINSIRSGECDVAIAGGIHLILGPSVHVGLDKGGFLSQNGRCATFDKDADGYVRGEGTVAFLLKPLSKAEADGDHIYAIIRGSAVNHGGRVNTLTTPNPNAQTEVVFEAWKQAGVDPRTISCIEAHGTGTSLGDPIETKALRRAFDELYAHYGIDDATRTPHCGLGSVKSNIGHLEFVAGASGVAKIVKAFEHGTLPESIHFNELNPYINLDKSPFYIIDNCRPWLPLQESDGRLAPRRAGVSSFGFGGVNCHVALEEYRKPTSQHEHEVITSSQASGMQVVALSAKSAEALERIGRSLLNCLRQTPAPALNDVAFTLAAGREQMSERLLIMANHTDELCASLQDFLVNRPNPTNYRGSKQSGAERLSFLKSRSEALRHARSLIEEDVIERMATAWVDGLDLEWSETRYVQGRRITLPMYPFDKIRYWIEKQGATDSPPLADKPDLNHEILEMLGEGLLTETEASELLTEVSAGHAELTH